MWNDGRIARYEWPVQIPGNCAERPRLILQSHKFLLILATSKKSVLAWCCRRLRRRQPRVTIGIHMGGVDRSSLDESRSTDNGLHERQFKIARSAEEWKNKIKVPTVNPILLRKRGIRQSIHKPLKLELEMLLLLIYPVSRWNRLRPWIAQRARLFSIFGRLAAPSYICIKYRVV